MDENTQTIVVQIQPAPASEQNIDLYWSLFWSFFAALLGVWVWKKIEQIFSTNHDD
ncbi:hypothetical protein GmRootV118_22930 [Variovorax sp. V118]|uniref:hypothetical protein n=1 Tax=Variovorax sp. V118 TaxID=3065954 RepID=UPI0034E876DA